MKQEMQIILEVNTQAEQFYEDAIQLGDHAAYAVKKKHRAQLTGLENIAESALKVSDILDYVKRQTARLPYWRQAFLPGSQATQGEKVAWHTIYTGDAPEKEFGERLKYYLEHELAAKRDVLCRTTLNINNETDENRLLRRHVYLLLIRQFVRQLVIQYEYRLSFDKERKGA